LRGSADKISETRLFPPWVKWVGIFISVFIVFIIFAICFETKPDVLWNSLIQVGFLNFIIGGAVSKERGYG
jgi:hypothetical protein